MPLYEYQCQSCENVIEILQSISDEPETTCPDCSGDLKKLISMSSFQLKGGGWYSEGYSSAPKNGRTPCAEKACSATNSSSSKEDTKPVCPKAAGSTCGC
ncbi:MAG: zinc ribbon domain-containing protein [Proteobacteria bacterium]|nr:zinc ribbon domain-containing protein [Pseudomonadota bacterium]MBU1710379.1 zinc ribbon domain-containing protein [Pseudomonadota bacterium]